jgi:pimeloyl-ACP methyl ester carboxylesterase
MNTKSRLFAALGVMLALAFLALAFSPSSSKAGKYVTVDGKNGVQLYYEESGSGDPVVFVPGWTMTVRYFDRQLEYFSSSRSTRFIVFDPRAHGRSTQTLDGANYRQHARDLKAFIDKLGLKHVVLGGWSWGMDTVYAYISMYGADNIRAVVDIDQTPDPLASGAGAWTDGDIAAVKQFFDAYAGDRIATTRSFLPDMFTKSLSADELRWMESETLKTPDIVANLLYYDGWMFDSTKIVRSLNVPQLFFVSEGNAAAAKAYLVKNRPDAELAPLGAHAMFYDHAPAFNERLASFLARHP